MTGPVECRTCGGEIWWAGPRGPMVYPIEAYRYLHVNLLYADHEARPRVEVGGVRA